MTLLLYSTPAEFLSVGGGHICLMFNISGQNVNFVPGGPKTGTLFYAYSTYALTSSNTDRLSNLFHFLNQKNICNNTITKIPPHLKCVATLGLPFGLPVFQMQQLEKKRSL